MTWNAAEGKIFSTSALEIPGVGCMVHVATREKDKHDGSVCFVPDVGITDDINGGHKLVRNRSFASGSLASGWVGTAGEQFDANMEALRKLEKENNPLGLPGAAPGDPHKLICELTDFFKESWNVCPTTTQRQRLIELLKANMPKAILLKANLP